MPYRMPTDLPSGMLHLVYDLVPYLCLKPQWLWRSRGKHAGYNKFTKYTFFNKIILALLHFYIPGHSSVTPVELPFQFVREGSGISFIKQCTFKYDHEEASPYKTPICVTNAVAYDELCLLIKK